MPVLLWFWFGGGVWGIFDVIGEMRGGERKVPVGVPWGCFYLFRNCTYFFPHKSQHSPMSMCTGMPPEK